MTTGACTCGPALAIGADLELGCPVHDDAAVENARRKREVMATVCGDVEANVMLVICECGRLRQHDRPHGFERPGSDDRSDS